MPGCFGRSASGPEAPAECGFFCCKNPAIVDINETKSAWRDNLAKIKSAETPKLFLWRRPFGGEAPDYKSNYANHSRARDLQEIGVCTYIVLNSFEHGVFLLSRFDEAERFGCTRKRLG
jgi:hypothetical protein